MTPWTAARQASLSFTNSQSLLKFTSFVLRPSNHPILCRLLLFLSSVFPSIRVFFSESALKSGILKDRKWFYCPVWLALPKMGLQWTWLNFCHCPQSQAHLQIHILVSYNKLLEARLTPDCITTVGAQELFLAWEGDMLLLSGHLTACQFWHDLTGMIYQYASSLPIFFLSGC